MKRNQKNILSGAVFLAIVFALVLFTYWWSRERDGIGGSFMGSDEREVVGESLVPLVKPGDVVRVDETYYDNQPIARGDIVSFTFASKPEEFIKLVVGVAGDAFRVRPVSGSDRAWQLVINDEVVNNLQGIPYRFTTYSSNMLSLYERDYGGIIPDGALLVLGNEVSGSFDSSAFGLISTNNIIGRVTIR